MAVGRGKERKVLGEGGDDLRRRAWKAKFEWKAYQASEAYNADDEDCGGAEVDEVIDELPEHCGTRAFHGEEVRRDLFDEGVLLRTAMSFSRPKGLCKAVSASHTSRGTSSACGPSVLASAS